MSQKKKKKKRGLIFYQEAQGISLQTLFNLQEIPVSKKKKKKKFQCPIHLQNVKLDSKVNF